MARRSDGTTSSHVHKSADIGGRHALRAQFAQAGRLRRFRQLAAVGVEDQPVMVIARRGQAEQRLQQAVHAGRPEQVLAAHHIGDALQRVVDARPRGDSWSACPCAPTMTSPQAAGSAAMSPLSPVGPAPVSVQVQRARPCHRRLHVEAERVGLAARRCARCAVRLRSSAAPRRDRAARRRDRAASARARRGLPPVRRSRRGSRSSERSAACASSLASAAR